MGEPVRLIYRCRLCEAQFAMLPNRNVSPLAMIAHIGSSQVPVSADAPPLLTGHVCGKLGHMTTGVPFKGRSTVERQSYGVADLIGIQQCPDLEQQES